MYLVILQSVRIHTQEFEIVFDNQKVRTRLLHLLWLTVIHKMYNLLHLSQRTILILRQVILFSFINKDGLHTINKINIVDERLVRNLSIIFKIATFVSMPKCIWYYLVYYQDVYVWVINAPSLCSRLITHAVSWILDILNCLSN